ncbi:MAG: methyltransferase [Pseudomonadota bacterium]
MDRLFRSAFVPVLAGGLLILSGSGISAAKEPRPLPANIAAAAADPARGSDSTQDARRHGPEILAFAGVKKGAVVIDLIPGGSYWTRLFAKAVGPNGQVHGIWPKPYADEDKRSAEIYATFAGSPAFPNVTSSIEPADQITAPARADLVFTAQNYHDYPDKFMGPVDPAVFNKAVFAALKPGGVFLVIDHAAAAGSGMRDTDTLHRIDPAIVKQQVLAAGFRFVGESKLLANPADDHSKLVFDKAIRGHTDQFIYKFRKPR